MGDERFGQSSEGAVGSVAGNAGVHDARVTVGLIESRLEQINPALAARQAVARAEAIAQNHDDGGRRVAWIRRQ